MNFVLDKRPALERLDNKILFRWKRLVRVSATALWTTLIEIAVKP